LEVVWGVTARLVCISRERGADGERIGRLVSGELGLQYLDEEVIVRAAEREGVDAEILADAEHRKSRLQRVADFLADAGAASAITVEPPAVRRSREEAHREVIRAVIDEIARDGSAVIVAHAASLKLADRDGVLRVLVVASPEVRAGRIAESEGVDDREAGKLVSDADAARAAYLKSFYDVDRELPTHYDLVVNTDRLEAERAADVIAQAARAVDR
jgi:cytidylate kinase